MSMNQKQRTDLLRERRELRDTIISDQKDIQYLMSELQGVANRDMGDPERVNHRDTYTDVFKDVNEVYHTIYDAYTSLEKQQQRLAEVNEQLNN